MQWRGGRARGGGLILGGMRWVSVAAVGTRFGRGETWDGGIVASLGDFGTLGTFSAVGNVVTLGTSTQGCWQRRTALAWVV